MSKSVDDWAEDFEDHPVRTTVKGFAIVIGVILVIGSVIWGLTVVFSGAKGQGDGVIRKNSAQNWISAQTAFHQQYESVKTAQVKIGAAKKSVEDFKRENPNIGNGTPWDPMAQQYGNLQTTLTGLQQGCMNTVSQYNTDAESYLTEEFRDAQLPDRLDPKMCE